MHCLLLEQANADNLPVPRFLDPVARCTVPARPRLPGLLLRMEGTRRNALQATMFYQNLLGKFNAVAVVLSRLSPA